MADTAHTVKSFDEDIQQVRSLVAQMGGLCEVQIIAAVDALSHRNPEAALAVITTDARIDAIEHEIEQLAVKIIALRAPMADDLREVVAALKISSVLERIGDYAKNIAKRASAMTQTAHIQPAIIIPEMARLVAQMVKDALDAYVAHDDALALAVTQRDAAVDDFYSSLFRSLLTFMMENPQHIHAVGAFAVHRQESRAHRRPCHQHRRAGPFQRHRRISARSAARRRRVVRRRRRTRR